ncbi:MAG: chorismate synthase [Bacteroidetes bacterium]|nr:chorismate synthase [Bacteroidota bacterium]
MAGNTFGDLFRLTTFGESHGPVIGGVIDGCPSNLDIEPDLIQKALDRRRPGQSLYVSPRQETDHVEILSGVFGGKTTGTPIAFIVKNTDSRSSDYEHLRNVYRPSHADYTYQIKYGIRDHRGGGRSSARETLARVVGGAFAAILLKPLGIRATACTSRIGRIGVDVHQFSPDEEIIESNPLRCPDPAVAREMALYLDQVAKAGDSAGSEVFCLIRNLPVGLGEPVFGKFQADLAKAMLSINGCNGFDIGTGFRSTSMLGSENNDIFIPASSGAPGSSGHGITTKTNHSGGVQGGITNGNEVYFRVSFKPVPSLNQTQQTVDADGNPVTLTGKGRHDLCIAPRAVPVVEAMAMLVCADHWLRFQAYAK